MPYIGNTIRAADDYRLIDDISSSFNGSTTSFALQVAGSTPVPFPKSPQQVLISVNGVIQEPDPTGASGFNLVGTNIVFSSAPTNGHAFFGIIYATADYLNAGGNFPSGSVGAPSFTFIGDEDTGIYRKGSGSVGFVSNSTEIANTDSNGITISSGGLILGDSSGASSNRIKLGASNDLQIYHNGSNSLIEDTGTGNLEIKTNGTKVTLQGGNNAMINAIKDGAVELYFNASLRLSTTANGVTLGHNLLLDNATNAGRDVTWDPANDQLQWKDNTKASFGSSSDLQIYHDGSDSYVQDIGTGKLILSTNGASINLFDSANSNTLSKFTTGGSVELYFDGSKKFDTNSGGVKIHGNLDTDDNNKLRIGTSSDLQIFHDGTDSFVQNNTGQLILRTATVESAVVCVPNGAVQLYHDNVKKLETTSNGIEVTGRINLSDNLDMPDSAKLVLGDGDDLKIYHDGSNSRIIEGGTGNLNIDSSAVVIRSANGSDDLAKFIQNGACELYHNDSKKLETTSAGITVTGNIAVSGTVDGADIAALSSSVSGKLSNVVDDTTPQLGGNLDCNNKVVTLNDSSGSGNNRIKIGNAGDLQIYHDASHSRIVDSGTGHLMLQTSEINIMNAAGTEDFIKGHSDGNVELYYDNSKKLETKSNGVEIVGHLSLADNNEIRLGNVGSNGDTRITHVAGSHTEINHVGTGDLILETVNGGDDILLDSNDDVFIQHNGEDMAQFRNDAEVNLYFDNSLKFQTTSTGTDLRGTLHRCEGTFRPYNNNTWDLGTSSDRWRNIYTNDLNLSNQGSSNDVDGTWGSYTIQEGAEDLFLINKRSGKKYKFNLTEVA